MLKKNNKNCVCTFSKKNYFFFNRSCFFDRLKRKVSSRVVIHLPPADRDSLWLVAREAFPAKMRWKPAISPLLLNIIYLQSVFTAYPLKTFLMTQIPTLLDFTNCFQLWDLFAVAVKNWGRKHKREKFVSKKSRGSMIAQWFGHSCIVLCIIIHFLVVVIQNSTALS